MEPSTCPSVAPKTNQGKGRGMLRAESAAAGMRKGVRREGCDLNHWHSQVLAGGRSGPWPGLWSCSGWQRLAVLGLLLGAVGCWSVDVSVLGPLPAAPPRGGSCPQYRTCCVDLGFGAAAAASPSLTSGAATGLPHLPSLLTAPQSDHFPAVMVVLASCFSVSDPGPGVVQLIDLGTGRDWDTPPLWSSSRGRGCNWTLYAV